MDGSLAVRCEPVGAGVQISALILLARPEVWCVVVAVELTERSEVHRREPVGAK